MPMQCHGFAHLPTSQILFSCYWNCHRYGHASDRSARRGCLYLLVTAIVFNSFVTVGVEAVGIEFLRTMGMDLTEAVAIVALLVVFKVGGRVIDLLVGRRWEDYISGLSQVR